MADRKQALPPARHEPQDISARTLSLGLAATLLVLLLSTLLVMAIYPSAVVDRRLVGNPPDYPEPRLQADPAADMRRFVANEQTQLNSFGCVDRARGIAHIPIDDAMQRVARDGIPDWPTTRKEP